MPSPADLVTLAAAQAALGGAGSNPNLPRLITSISMAIMSAANRTSLLPKTYTEVRDGNPRGIMLRNWPVIAISSVTIGGPFSGSTMALQASSGGQRGYVLDVADDPLAGTPQMLTAPWGGFPRGESNVTITYSAGYQITSEAQAVPAGGGTVDVTAPFGAWGSDQGVSYASGGALSPVAAGSEAQGRYSVTGGAYKFAAADAGAALLISYGFIPADLANACLDWIADRLAYADRIGKASQSLGGQETVSYRIAAVPDFVKSMIQNYMNPVPIV